MTSTGAVRVEQVPWLVGVAGRAPSLHNSQPWRFCYEDGLIELHPDRSRQVRFCDPVGRELVLSCGAALFTLQVAIASRGARPLVDVLPEPDRPDLLARVDLEPHAAPGARRPRCSTRSTAGTPTVRASPADRRRRRSERPGSAPPSVAGRGCRCWTTCTPAA